jgi:hypothetical protein
MKKKQRSGKMEITEAGMVLAQTMASALGDVEHLPRDSWWPMALSLLPEWFHVAVLRWGADAGEQVLANLGLTIATIIEVFTADLSVPEDARARMTVPMLYGLTISSVLELERRHKRICGCVPEVRNPFAVVDMDLHDICPESGVKVSLRDLLKAHGIMSESEAASIVEQPPTGDGSGEATDAEHAVVLDAEEPAGADSTGIETEPVAAAGG